MTALASRPMPLPHDETGRLAALHDAQLLDTPPEADYDDIAALAAEICGTPIGLVSLVDADRQWFKASVGVDTAETSRDIAFCAHPVADRRPLEVPDATKDDRFAGNPLVTEQGLQFYAGAPMLVDGGHAVGTVCVLDRKPRQLTPGQQRALRSLARHAAVQIDLRRYARRATDVAERLRQLDRMKDSFLAGVSHELRTPLTTIRGYIEVLLDTGGDGLPPETVQRFLNVMYTNSSRLLHLIDDLLLVARLHEDGLNLCVVDLDLADLAHQVTLASRPLAEHKGIDLRDDTTTPVLVNGDAQRLSQALNHVVFNAIKFTPPGGDILVSTSRDPEPTVTVHDTGAGIPDQDLPHLFDRFYRTADADEQAVQGPGLGLSIVKAIIDAHHGSITITSGEDGTTAHITLPAAAPLDRAG